MAADLASIVLLLNHLFSRACLDSQNDREPINRMGTCGGGWLAGV